MTTYALTVVIDSEIYPWLKPYYNLCIARKVNNMYNVVWYGGDFQIQTVVTWKEKYEVFGTTTYADGALVQVDTNSEPILFGQTCIFDGIMEPVTGIPVPSSGTFFVEDTEGTMHIGVGQVMSGTMWPIFVSPSVVKGLEPFAPLNSVMVWFDKTLKTNTMFSHAISNPIEVVYNGTTSHTVTYNVRGEWIRTEAQAKKMYSMTEGFSYMDSQPDPYVFADSVRGVQIPPLPTLSTQATTTSGFAAPPPEIEGILQFSTAADANNAWAFLKQKIMHNIQQDVPPKVDDNTVKVTLKLAAITFMKDMIKGANDSERVKNAFLSELQALAQQPTLTQLRMGGLAVMDTTKTCQLVALDTAVALNRDVQHQSVYGYVLTKVSRSISIAWFMSRRSTL